MALDPDVASPASQESETRPPVDRRYLDPTLDTNDRIDFLLAQMTLQEKAGLMFHTMLMPGQGGEVTGSNNAFGLPSAAELVLERSMSHFNVLGSAGSPEDFATWHNRLQELGKSTRLGIPVTLSSDPRHSFTDNPGTAALAGAFSQWPEPLGLAAIGREDVVQKFGDIVRQEYLAVGLRVALHPQIDLTTEPRWSRQSGTFGEDAELTSRLVSAYILGLQGAKLGRDSVATMTKHFPGAGPQAGGEDAHFAYGREQTYPGGMFEHHLKPFEAAFEAGTSQIMPYYGMPIGTEYDEVGFGFNKSVITGLLRERYGFDGIVCTDWGLLTDGQMMGESFPARAWGVEHLTVPERMAVAIAAGVDQFGGEAIPDVLVELVESGVVTEARLDVSARRLLREKFVLGLFDQPDVNVEHAARIVGSPEFRMAGEQAQRASLTLLANSDAGGTAVIPRVRGLRLYVEGIEAEVAAEYGTVVTDPDAADLAILRIQAPYEQRPGVFEAFFHAGSLEFDAEVVAHVRGISERVPTVLDIYLDRPAVLTPFNDLDIALIASFGSNARAVLDVAVGDASPGGRLPFDLPRSMAAVEASREDVPFDTADPLFRFGHGLAV